MILKYEFRCEVGNLGHSVKYFLLQGLTHNAVIPSLSMKQVQISDRIKAGMNGRLCPMAGNIV
jgi:hypothetical protein